MSAAALARYDANAERAHDGVRAMLATIRNEIAENEGVYPHNKGALSLAEIARRAGIHPQTFHKPRYVELAAEVKAWLKALKQEASGVVVGRMRVRSELGSRLLAWKHLYEELLETHRISETDLALVEAKLEDALKENEILRQRLAEVTRQKVVSLRSKG
ncbi:hypothetical protein [Ralstonia pseudosolanacearum]|uniref:hypothetical protein n=1 Tax=Ralstonia pseudosolanacearum TaxID=1310165 RepID=UPI0018D00DC1|nr:hypothetical protein [Ralstonia pseudosolanacearum]